MLELPEARAFAFGIVLAAAVGPIALIIATNSLRFGFGSGVRGALGAALGDLTYATLAAAAGATIQTIVSEHARQIHFAASFGLSLFGMFLIVQACRASMPAAGIEQAQVSTPHGGFRSTYVLTLVNPITVIFFGGFIAQLPHGFAVRRLATVVASLFMGSLVVQVGIAAGGAVVGSRIRDERWIRILNVASGIGLTAFGLLKGPQTRHRFSRASIRSKEDPFQTVENGSLAPEPGARDIQISVYQNVRFRPIPAIS